MKCNSCEAEIPPSFVKAIQNNSCPACDGPIMLQDTIDLMVGLKTALEQMPNDPQGIAGWLLSNYRMQKVGTGEPTGFYGIKSSKTSSKPSDESNLKIADNPLQKFYKNAGIKPEQQANYKLLAAQINAAKEDEDSEELEDSEDSEDYVPESEDPEYTKQALKTMIGPNIKKNKQYQEPDFDDAGLDDLHPSLHQDRLKRLEKQKDLVLGGGVGKIKRSS